MTLLRMKESLEERGHEMSLLFEAPPIHPYSWVLLRLQGRAARVPLTEDTLKAGAMEADRGADGVDLILSVLGDRLLAKMHSTKPVVLVTDATWKLLKAEYPELREPDDVDAAAERAAAEQATLRRAELRVFSSPWARASALQDYGVPAASAIVVPFGANLTPSATGSAASVPARGGRCELLFVGSNWHRKGGDRALAVLDALLARGLRVRLTTVGQDPPRNPERPDGALRHLGSLQVNRPAQASAYEAAFREAHFLVLPTRADCTPIVCAEASSFGVPTLACEVGGLRAMVQPGVNGHLLDRNASAGDFASLIAHLWSDPRAYAALRQSSRALFEQRLNWGAWAADVEKAMLSISA